MNPEEARTFADEYGVDVLETTAEVDELPRHNSFALALAYDDDEFFMVRSAKEGRQWEIPGGKVEVGESFVEAAKREFREETGHEFELPEPIAVVIEEYKTERSEKEVVGIVFSGKRGKKVREPEDDTAEVESFEELPEELTFITFTRRTFERLVELGESE